MIGPFGYWDAVLWSTLFALLVAALWILFNPGKLRKVNQYLCGEEMEYSTPISGFYDAFEEALGSYIRSIRAYQSGSINDYIAYIVTFTSLAVLLIIIAHYTTGLT